MLTYNQLMEGHEEPEDGPNVITYGLTKLLGLDHNLCHRAFVKVNPTLLQEDNYIGMSADYLMAFEDALYGLIVTEGIKYKQVNRDFVARLSATLGVAPELCVRAVKLACPEVLHQTGSPALPLGAMSAIQKALEKLKVKQLKKLSSVVSIDELA